MRITSFSFSAFLGAALGATTDEKKWRDKLTSLLHEIDSKSGVDNLEKYISAEEVGSLLERSDHAHTSGAYYYFNPRRRHSPCECPDSPGDARATACIDRRYNALTGAYQAASLPSEMYGFSSDTGRNILRLAYQNLANTVSSRTMDTGALQKNLTDPSTGYQVGSDRMLQRILNEETLMAQSVNSAWMSLVNATSITVSSSNAVQGLMANATQAMLTWFTGLQTAQDKLSYANMVTTVKSASDDLSSFVKSINDAQAAVWSILSQLDLSMGGSESTTSSLADSLNSAADTLSSKISLFNASLVSAGQPTVNDAQSQIAQMLNSLQTYTNGQISTLGSSAMGKEKSTRDSSNQQIASQWTSSQQLLSAAQNQTTASLASAQAQQDSATVQSQNAYSSVASYVESAVQSQSTSLSNKVSNYRTNLSTVAGGYSQVNNFVTSYNNDEKSALTSAKTDIGNAQSQAQKELGTDSAAADSKSSQSLTSISTVSQNSLASVGTNFQSNLDQMGLNSDKVFSSLSSDANSAAKQASSSQSSLAISAAQGSAAIASASDTVTSQLHSAFKNVLNSLGNIPGGIPATSMSSSALLSVIQAAKSNMTTASQLVQQMFYGSQAGSLKNSTEAQNAVGNFLTVIQNMAPTADTTIQKIGTTLQGASSASNSATLTANQQSQQNGQATANAATQISVAQSNFADMLSGIVNQMAASGGGAISSGVGSTLSDSAAMLAEWQKKYDDAVAAQASQANTNANAIDSARAGAASAGSSASGQAGSAFQNLNETISGAMADIDSFLAGAQNDASASVQEQISKINSIQAQSAIQVGQIDTDQMSQIRSVAASTNALMTQINSFLKQNSLPLSNDVQGLESSAQKLFMYMNTLQGQHDSLKTDAADEGPYSWSDVLRAMLSSLRADNATGIDQLNRISAYFNSSASALASNVSATLSSLAAQYASSASSLQSQLSASSDSAIASLSDSVTGGSVSTIDQIKWIQGNISELSATAASGLSNASANIAGLTPGSIHGAYVNVSAASQAAAQDALFASAILAQVQANATLAMTRAQLALQQNSVPTGDVQRAGSLSLLNASVAQSQLAQQKAAIDQLLSDSSSITDDYAGEVQAQQQARQGQASLVYDSVVAAKGQAAASMGEITQRIAQERAARSSNVSLTQADQQVQIGLLRHGVTSLANLLEKFVLGVRSSFDQSQSDQTGFAAALLGSIRQKLTQLDNAIYKDNQDIVQEFVDLDGSSDSFIDDQFDNDVETLRSQVEAWANQQAQAVTDQDSSISNLVNSTTLAVPASLNATIDSAVLSVAQTAKSVLDKNGIQIPAALSAYISEYR